MGNYIGYGQSNEPDPKTGLTPREKYLVTSTWAILKKDLRETGCNVMLTYFKDFPHYQSYFPFKDIPYEELKSTPKFRAHCANLIYALSSIIDSLDDLETMISILLKTGENHVKHKAPAQGFEDLKGSFMTFLNNELTFRMTDECTMAWTKTINVAFKIITDTLNESQ